RIAPIARLADALRPETHIYGLGREVLFDCALAPAGTASISACPTQQTDAPLAARRASPPSRAASTPLSPPAAAIPSTSASCTAATCGSMRHMLADRRTA